MGPEQPIDILTEHVQSNHWGVAGIGFGVRGSNRTDLTIRFTGQYYRDLAFLEVSKLMTDRHHFHVSPESA